ncbi:PhoX family protein [Roseococcus sp. DSY-14]|uniref:PhoX family protein n=1 Tax=Roseococcus sp. DSY-14 TaxID=3369650 RepID=UPI00387AA8AE
MDESEDIGIARPMGVPFGVVLSRRAALLGALAAPMAAQAQGLPRRGGPSSLTFAELPHQLAQEDAVAPGHRIQVVIRWGDPVLPGAPPFDPRNVTAAAQAMQFGYNNDYLALLPLRHGEAVGGHGLLWANHEYTNTNLMFPGMGSGAQARARVTAAQVAVEMAAHGGSVVEIAQGPEGWKPVEAPRLNRRVTADTPMEIRGPAAGHPWMRTGADPAGTRVLGMLNNCAGGVTPWGTVLTCEENINFYFGGEAPEDGQAAHRRRYGIGPNPPNGWHRHVPRFSLAQEPNEPNRFGWVVELDIRDPASTPVKRTALGRFKHEGATFSLARDGRVVIHMGDDERFEYVYRFVTARAHDPANPAASRDLLDEGTLSVARFEADGTMRWLPLVHGQGPLTEANGFHGQGDVLIQARRAADLLGATPMDRPEDVETNPVNGRTYVMLTNNDRRTAQQVNAANPRPANRHGHVVEITPEGGDHGVGTARWTIFLRAGRPGMDAGAEYHRAVSDSGWLSCPDNCAFDSKGRIWIATDGADTAAGIADGLYAADTAGPGRALTRCFYQAPAGAEVCGPWIAEGDRAIFLAIQHPGEVAGSSWDTPATRWPDFTDGVPPRPSVVVLTREDGGPIG